MPINTQTQADQPNTTEEETRPPYADNADFLDIGWTVEDERLEQATEQLYNILPYNTLKERKDAVANLKRHTKAMLIVCARIHQLDRSRPLIFPKNTSFGMPSYKGKYSPYNPMAYNFKKLQEVTASLVTYGYLEEVTGKQAWFGDEYTFVATRYTLTDRFVEFIDSYELASLPYEEQLLNGGAVIALKNDRGATYVLKDYTGIREPEDVRRSKEWLPLYNDLINRSDITLSHQPEEEHIDFRRKTTQRRFRNNYNHNGRYNGGWWTYCKKKNRPYITINDEQTVECDYTANHLHLYYGMNGQSLPEAYENDPYQLDERYPRDLVKLIITRNFNSRGQYQGILRHLEAVARSQKQDTKTVKAKTLINRHIPSFRDKQRLVDLIYSTYPLLRENTHYSIGLTLMNWDSKVAGYILEHMTAMGIPTLGIHDSFIVPISQKDVLRNVMRDAYVHFFGDTCTIPNITDTMIEDRSS